MHARPVRAGVCALVLALAACSAPLPPPTDPAALVQVTARPAPAEGLPVRLRGTLQHRSPLGHAPPLDWMPIAWVSPEGGWVETGDRLMLFDPFLVRTWLENDRWNLESARSEVERQRLEGEGRLADLRARRAELTAELVSARAWQDASERRDQVGLRVAEFASQRALRALAVAEQRMAQLAATPGSPEIERLHARAELAQRRASATAARLALATARRGAADDLRERMRIWVERCETGLAAAGGGIEAELALAEIQAANQVAQATEALRRLEEVAALRAAAIADPELRSATAGLVQHRDGAVRRGDKRPARDLISVLPPGGMAAFIGLPERLRDQIAPWHPGAPGTGRVRIRPDLSEDRVIPGRILSIGAVPTGTPGKRSFPAVVAIDGADGDLRPGMGCSVEIMVGAGTGGVVVPSFAVRPGPPAQVATPGGGRQVEALFCDDGALVLRGLLPGEPILPWSSGPDGPSGLRLSGSLRAARFHPLRLNSGGWDVVEVIEDGAQVEAGAVVAILAPNGVGVDLDQIRSELAWWRERAHATRTLSRLQARLEADRALLDLRRARLDTRAVAVAEDPALAAPDAGGRILAGAACQVAELALAEARLRSAALDDPATQAATPALEAAALRAQVEVASIRLDLARLRFAQVRRTTDGLAAWRRRESVLVALDKEAVAATAWQLAREGSLRAWLRSESVFGRSGREARRNRELLADAVIVAPVAGRVFHRAGKPIVAGSSLDTQEPFFIPIGTERRLDLELPVRCAGRFRPGDQVPVVVPGLGGAPRSGRILTVGTIYGPSASARAGLGAEQVTNLVLSLDLSEADAERALPGMTAWIEL